MGKNKINKCLPFFILLLFGCVALDRSKNMPIEDCYGKYTYENKNRTLNAELILTKDSSFKYMQISGMGKKYSTGSYRISKNALILTSEYTGSFLIPPVSWVSFKEEHIELKRGKLVYNGYSFKREK